MNEHITYHEADFQAHEGKAIRCLLCPHACLLREGQSGLCRVREHRDGTLVSTVYGYPSALQIDPIEKKPLYHFLPGSRTFSLGTQGCNLACKFCQNWHLSAEHGHAVMYVEPAEIVRRALREGCESIAFTYNEPIVFSEYAMAVCGHAKKAGLACLYVTNGYITPEARALVFPMLDAVNIDLKAFSDEVYKEFTGGTLNPVLNTIEWCVQNRLHTEITTLLIPGVNDSEAMLSAEFHWIMQHCGADIPLHLSAFHPDYKMNDYPNTSRPVLEKARRVAVDSGLRYVYVGNYPGFDNATYCPECGEPVIERHGYSIRKHEDHPHQLPIIWSMS